MTAVYRLFSRARRSFIDDVARLDVRESKPTPERIETTVLDMLDKECPGLVQHQLHRIMAVVADPSLPKGRLPTKVCRVRVDTKYFVFTLTRQSPYDGVDPRDDDGGSLCWFVWSIQPEEKKRGKDRDTNKQPAPSGLELVITA